MSYQLRANKIRHEHLERCAFVYVRQSTMQQIRENTTSTQRQYDLTKLAADLGWEQEKIIVVDQDQARSGASTEGRDGFKRMLSEIALGNVGAVISLEASRLARDSSAWHQLLKICDVTNTLVVDEIGIYDPRDRDDRLLLGFKGTMSEAELSLIVGRMIGARKKKAEEGNLSFNLPMGFVHNAEGRITLDPDEEVGHVIRLLFEAFESHSSVWTLVRELNKRKILFPTQVDARIRGGEIRWTPLNYTRALWILHHPMYAGAYVYGRTQSYRHIDSESSIEVSKRIRNLGINDWEVLRLNNHQGYISWEQYLHNQKRIGDNRNLRKDSRPGAIRAGAALLQGIALCGKCGHQMRVGYSRGKKYPHYYCYGTDREFGILANCQRFSARLVDKAVADAFIEAIQPAQLQLSIKTIERFEAEVQRVGRQWDLRVEKACYEADLSRRRFAAVDPENRLVARNLERDWNEKLSDVERLKRERTTAQKNFLRALTPSERQSILNLARDLSKVWNAQTTTQVERKQLLRYLIKDVTVLRDGKTLHMNIRWQTEACTQLNLNLLPPNPRKTDSATLAIIRKLAPDHTNKQIAVYLNQAGVKTRRGLPFNEGKVGNIKYYYNLPYLNTTRPVETLHEDGRYSVRAAARMLDVCTFTIHRWCQSGRLDANKSGSSWRINLTQEKVAELRKAE